MKRALERTFLDDIWIDKPTPRGDVGALIRRLKPIAKPGGLRRFGPPGDGGYLMPDDLEGVAACISPGVSRQCGFDEEIAVRGIDVVMADASVEGPPTSNPRFHFVPKFVDIFSSDRTVTMDELCSSGPAAQTSSDLILQMDIEGAEYRVLASLSDALLKRFRIIVIEFHQLDEMFSRFGFALIAPVFEKLLTHHDVVHVHPNNCLRPIRRASLTVPPIMEFTFYRKDRTPGGSLPTHAFPHALDVDNVPTRPSVVLPDCWWR